MAVKGGKTGGIEDRRTFLPDVIGRSEWTHPVFHASALHKS